MRTREQRQVAGHQGWCGRLAKRMQTKVADPPLPPIHAYTVVLGSNVEQNGVALYWGFARWIKQSASPDIVDFQILVDHYPCMAIMAPAALKQADVELLAMQRGVPSPCFQLGSIPFLPYREDATIPEQLEMLIRNLSARFKEPRLSIAIGVPVTQAGLWCWHVKQKPWKTFFPGVTVVVDPLPLVYLNEAKKKGRGKKRRA